MGAKLQPANPARPFQAAASRLPLRSLPRLHLTSGVFPVVRSWIARCRTFMNSDGISSDELRLPIRS
jgi:hypothetical protein